jgi:hypothetical protein
MRLHGPLGGRHGKASNDLSSEDREDPGAGTGLEGPGGLLGGADGEVVHALEEVLGEESGEV